LSPDDAHLGLSNNETDIAHFNTEDAPVVTLGVGYELPFHEHEEDNEITFLPAMTASIDGTYQFETQFSGDVWMNESPVLNNLNNRTEIENFNAMFNLALDLARYQRFSLFILGGLGAAWSTVEYKDEPKPNTQPDSGIALASETTTTFAWQGGGGLKYDLMECDLAFTLTYLFTSTLVYNE